MEWEGREGKEKEGKEKEGKGWWWGEDWTCSIPAAIPSFSPRKNLAFPPAKTGSGERRIRSPPPFILIPADHFWGQLAALPPRPLCPFKAPAPLIDVSGPV